MQTTTTTTYIEKAIFPTKIGLIPIKFAGDFGDQFSAHHVFQGNRFLRELDRKPHKKTGKKNLPKIYLNSADSLQGGFADFDSSGKPKDQSWADVEKLLREASHASHGRLGISRTVSGKPKAVFISPWKSDTPWKGDSEPKGPMNDEMKVATLKSLLPSSLHWFKKTSTELGVFAFNRSNYQEVRRTFENLIPTIPVCPPSTKPYLLLVDTLFTDQAKRLSEFDQTVLKGVLSLHLKSNGTFDISQTKLASTLETYQRKISRSLTSLEKEGFLTCKDRSDYSHGRVRKALTWIPDSKFLFELAEQQKHLHQPKGWDKSRFWSLVENAIRSAFVCNSDQVENLTSMLKSSWGAAIDSIVDTLSTAMPGKAMILNTNNTFSQLFFLVKLFHLLGAQNYLQNYLESIPGIHEKGRYERTMWLLAHWRGKKTPKYKEPLKIVERKQVSLIVDKAVGKHTFSTRKITQKRQKTEYSSFQSQLRSVAYLLGNNRITSVVAENRRSAILTDWKAKLVEKGAFLQSRIAESVPTTQNEDIPKRSIDQLFSSLDAVLRPQIRHSTTQIAF